MEAAFEASPPGAREFSKGIPIPKSVSCFIQSDSGCAAGGRLSMVHVLNDCAGVLACDGRDIVKKGGTRKLRYLLSFPGVLSEVTGGGKCGRLVDMDTPTPGFVVEFPQVPITLLETVLQF